MGGVRMKEFFQSTIFFGVICGFLGAFAMVGVYEILWPIARMPIAMQSLFSLAIVSMYFVALMIALISLSFTVFGRQWIIDLVSTKVKEDLSDLEKRNISRAHARVGYVLWQLSKGENLPIRLTPTPTRFSVRHGRFGP